MAGACLSRLADGVDQGIYAGAEYLKSFDVIFQPEGRRGEGGRGKPKDVFRFKDCFRAVMTSGVISASCLSRSYHYGSYQRTEDKQHTVPGPVKNSQK